MSTRIGRYGLAFIMATFLLSINIILETHAESALTVTNPRIVDAFGNSLNSISAERMVQITADVTNNLDTSRDFAFVITKDNLAHASWVTGTLAPSQTLSPSLSQIFNKEGTYQVKLYFTLLPQNVLNPDNPNDFSGFAKSENQLSNPILLKINVGSTTEGNSIIVESSENEKKIPSWLRNNVIWWSEKKIGDKEFLTGIEYLIENKIIQIENLPESKPILEFVDPTRDPQHYVERYENEKSYREWFDKNYPNYSIYEAVGLPKPGNETVPDWVRNNAIWWAEGRISEIEFINGISFLIEQQIIRAQS